jgi:SAM-dependent methyltransferase
MWSDIIDLRDFYETPLGRLAGRLVSRCLRLIWPSVAGQRVVGIGYAIPYLEGFQEDAERTLAVMPAGQGVVHWPAGAPARVALADENSLPLPDRSVDRLLLAHCLEGTAEVRLVLRECWRVLADGGRLVVIVTNRRGIWSRAEHVPFAQGRPFSTGQLTRLLRDSMFAPTQSAGALFMPPVWWRLFRSWAVSLEELGARWFPTFAGVVVMEAEKQIYAAPPIPAGARRVLPQVRPGPSMPRGSS